MPMVGLTKEEDNVPITSDHVVITATLAKEWLTTETSPWSERKQENISRHIS